MRKAHPARVPDYLQHIIEAIDRATGYVAGWTPQFLSRTPAHRTP
jgi:hypothetical protein